MLKLVLDLYYNLIITKFMYPNISFVVNYVMH
jgi:hypothetical protein